MIFAVRQNSLHLHTTHMNIIHTPNEKSDTLNVIGSRVMIRLHGRDTNGLISIVECHDDPGSGPPPHTYQREDETFYVLEGEYEFRLGEKTFTVREGSTIFAPRGLAHSFRSMGPELGRLLVTLTSAGFEGFFEEVGALTPEQQQIPRVLEIGRKYELEFLPPPDA